jgi:hypothetical protein
VKTLGGMLVAAAIVAGFLACLPTTTSLEVEQTQRLTLSKVKKPCSDEVVEQIIGSEEMRQLMELTMKYGTEDVADVVAEYKKKNKGHLPTLEQLRRMLEAESR